MSLTVCHGITIGAVGGFLAGLTIWIVKLIKVKRAGREKEIVFRDAVLDTLIET